MSLFRKSKFGLVNAGELPVNDTCDFCQKSGGDLKRYDFGKNTLVLHSGCYKELNEQKDAMRQINERKNSKAEFGLERRNSRIFDGVKRFGSLLNEWEGPEGGQTLRGKKPPESGRVVDATGKTLLIFHGYDHLLRWFVKEGIGDMATFIGLGYKFENAGPDKYEGLPCSCGGKFYKVFGSEASDPDYECDECGKIARRDDWGRGLKEVENAKILEFRSQEAAERAAGLFPSAGILEVSGRRIMIKDQTVEEAKKILAEDGFAPDEYRVV